MSYRYLHELADDFAVACQSVLYDNEALMNRVEELEVKVKALERLVVSLLLVIGLTMLLASLLLPTQ